ncbi:hypothetical protein RhiirA5_439132 [Rhizophagus irregularis]|uniref:Nuclease harbi1 n=1 Tax=Rhizophagus irregularis TaxID=588596 RepID=A0A2N0NI98_9GLOM|nr:hypothetical protein RhiirA5_439132 [Rhizophagus irregularis]
MIKLYAIFICKEILSDSSCEETTDDDNDLLLVHECIDVIEWNNSLRTVYRLGNAEFKRHFRITKITFEWLCTGITPILLQRNNSRGAPRLPIKHKVSLTLWFLATGQSYRTLGQLFALGESTICYVIRSVLQAIKCHFLSSKIQFPNSYAEFSDIAKRFKRKAGIPYVIGAIDGSHIPIKAPKEFPIDYYNTVIIGYNEKFEDEKPEQHKKRLNNESQPVTEKNKKPSVENKKPSIEQT